MSDLKYFPDSYNQSRTRFSDRIKSLSGVTGTWKIPGKRDDDLFVDHVWLPATGEKKSLIVLTSGIHGAEAYLGAAVQMMFIDELLPSLNRENTGVLIVHSMNPYGFKHHQRCTEGNVNLNRNFSTTGEIFTKRFPEAVKLNERFLEKGPVGSLRSKMFQTMQVRDNMAFFDGISLETVVKVLSPGQFETHEHVEYGGNRMEPQSVHFVSKLRELMPQYKNILGLDLHTGLGDRGRLHMLNDGYTKLGADEMTRELFDFEADKEFYVFTPPEAQGFYEVHGAINSAFCELAQPGQRVCALTMEFGTLGHSVEAQLDGMNRFLLEHQGHLYGYANKEIEERVRAWNFERSLMPDVDWRMGTMRAARGTLQKVVSRIG